MYQQQNTLRLGGLLGGYEGERGMDCCQQGNQEVGHVLCSVCLCFVTFRLQAGGGSVFVAYVCLCVCFKSMSA